MSFKSSMANYYHEARAQVKKIKTLQEEGKRRAERRAELIAPVVSLTTFNNGISVSSILRCSVMPIPPLD